MTIKENAIRRNAPKPLSKVAAIPFYNMICELNDCKYPIPRKYLSWIDKCEAVNELSQRAKGKTKIPAARIVAPVDLTATKIKLVTPERKFKPVTVKNRLIWGSIKDDDTPPKSPTIIVPNKDIVSLNKNWMVTYDNMDENFWAWINSINRGFQFTEHYQKFDDYVKQANSWLSDRKSITDCVSDSDRDNFVMLELRRFDCNKLYFLNKYWPYQDASSRTGFTIFKAGKAQAILCYLYDCRWDLDIAKARQVYFTTVMDGIAVAEILVHNTFFIKMITADTSKAKETFLQKLRLPFAALPPYIRPSQIDNAHGVFQGDFHFELRNRGDSNSALIRIVPPSIDAVNSGSPDVRYIDEQALISIIKEMRNEMKSSALKEDPITGKLIRKGQGVYWGSSDAIQFPQFETIHRSGMEAWLKHDITRFSALPLYFNVWARPAMTQDVYDELKKEAYSDTSIKREHTITQFHQSFPIDYDDMFLSNPLTLIPLDMINSSIKRIDSVHLTNPDNVCEYGFFTPIYDQGNQIQKSSDQPFKIVGAEWFPVKDRTNKNAIWCIFRHPPKDERWVDRWYAGTDPIMGVSGHSRHSKTILDGIDGLPSALMASRSDKPDFEYLQSLLGSLYYGADIDELVEVNFGAAYMKWVTDNGYDYLLIPRKSLPQIYQINSSEVYGISKKAGANSRHILNAGWEYLDKNHDKIWIRQYFEELKTYVNKPTTQGTNGGDVVTSQFRYGPKDPDIHYDDAIDSLFYAVIAWQAYGFKVPKNTLEARTEKTLVWKTVRDSNFNLVRMQVEQ